MVGKPGLSEYHLRADAPRDRRSSSTFTHFTQGSRHFAAHQGQFPATTLSFNLAENVSLSDAVAAINRAEVEMGLPANITGKFAGTRAGLSGSPCQPAHPDLDGAAGRLYRAGNTVREPDPPLTIISTLPSAGVGALMAMVLFGSDLDIVA